MMFRFPASLSACPILVGTVGLALLLGCMAVAPARAGLFHYDLVRDASRIDLTVTGSLLGGQLTVTEQFPSDVTRYQGTMAAEFATGFGSGGSIGFPGGGAAGAEELRGGFLNLKRRVSPAVDGEAGTDPANYGVTLDAPLEIDLPPIPLPDPFGETDLGTLESVTMDVAIRELVIDLTAAQPTPIEGEGFDASAVDVRIVSGFADVNGAFVLQQDNLLSYATSLLALGALAASMPELGLTTSGNFLTLEIELGIGTRFDLSSLPGAPPLSNMAATDGSLSYDPATGNSVLTIPIDARLPDLGIPTEIFDLQFRLEGQLVGTSVVPEPSSLTLAGLAVALLAPVVLRRRRKAQKFVRAE